VRKQWEPNELDGPNSNPENYKWGIFYFNPRDSRTILPKRYKWMGWTLNFANPKSYLIILGIIGFAVLLEFLLN
jgi:uncharacterized membrane protein